jgi:hypothetical protein
VATYPTGNYLADILKAVAKIISGGLKTRLYLVSISGFDTHAQQVEADHNIGNHANLLSLLSSSCLAFQRDLEAMNLANRVLGMSFSEFGRRIISNDSLGTDHGAAAPMFVFGTNVQGGVIGTNPNIPTVASPDDNIPMQYDFRNVYSSILKDWFCMSQSNVNDVLLKNFQTLPIVKNNCSVGTLDDFNKLEDSIQMEIYPNPMVDRASIEINVLQGNTLVQLFDPLGKMIQTIFKGKLNAGKHIFSLVNENYSPGNYYIRVQNNAAQKLEPVMIVR